MQNIINNIKNFLKGIGIFLLYLIVIPGISFMIFFYKGLNAYSKTGTDIRYLLTEIFLLACIFFIFRKDMIHDFKDFKKNFKQILKISLKYWLVGLGITIICNFLINYVFFPEKLAVNEELNRSYLHTYPIYAISSLTIIAPIIEEMIFRLNFKKRIKNNTFFLIFSSLFFASIHLIASFNSLSDIITNWQQLFYILPYGALGFAFGKCYLKSNNIYCSIIAHQMQNILSVGIILLSL